MFLLAIATQVAAQVPTFFYPTVEPGQRQAMQLSSEFIAVVTRATRSRQLEIGAAVVEPTPVFTHEARRVSVLRLKTDPLTARNELNKSVGQSLEAVLDVYHAAPAGRVLVESPYLAVGLRPGTDAAAVWQQYGLEPVRQLSARGSNAWLVRVLHPEAIRPTVLANQMFEAGDPIVYAMVDYLLQPVYPQVPARPQPIRRQFVPLFTPNDPLYAQQWHLNNTGQGGGAAGADISAPEAWDITRGSASIRIAVIDDAVQVSHEDLNVNGKIVAPADVAEGDNDPSPAAPTGEEHGTSVSGVATAAGNNAIGVSGSAPDCSLIPIRLGAGALPFTSFAAAFDHARLNNAAVCNNSWFLGIGQTPQPIHDAITNLAIDGRNGQGCLVLFAAGNFNGAPGDEHTDTGNSDMLAPQNHPEVFVVAATNDSDIHSYYSDTGDVVDFAAPSNGGVSGITTTDITGAGGYGPGNYTNDFGGTSSACPLAAGVAGLVISLDPSRTRAEYYTILTETADKVDAALGNYDSNGHSRFYGYGRLNANSAIQRVLLELGTQVTFQVETINLADGGRPIGASAPILVSYTIRGTARTVAVTESNPVTVGVDAGSEVTFAAQDSANGSSQRWITSAPTTATIGSQPVTLTGRYYHQLRRQFRVDVQAGAVAIDDAHAVPATVVDQGQTQNETLTGTAKLLWADTGSAYTIAAEATGGTADQLWRAADTNADGVSDPISGTITLQQPEVVGQFFHLVRPRVVLNGTNASNTVNVTKRKILGATALQQNISGIFQDLVDNQSQLAFSQQTSGQPTLEAEGVHEFGVTPENREFTVTYVVQPQTDQSTLAVSRATAPANDRTEVTVTVTVRDSAGGPVAGIDAARVDVFATPVDGVRITNPTGQTDATGRLLYQLTSNQPQEVTLSATLDGQEIDSTTTIEFLQVMSVPLPQPGIYLMSFPITPADSHRAIADFAITPQPPRVARLIPGTNTYDFYRADQPKPLLDIRPGRGFYIRTNTTGVAELTGERSTGPTYTFPLPAVGFHMLGNPQVSEKMIWRLSDFEVRQGGVSRGLLSDPAVRQLVDPFVWGFNGQTYELICDPTLPGTDGLRTQVQVFEGFFWRSHIANAEVVYTPNSNRAEVAQPITAGHFGLQLIASAGGARSTAIVGADRQATRASAAPEAPDGGDLVRLEILGDDQSRAAAEWLGTPVIRPTTWRLAVSSRQVDQDVTLSWPHLNRQLPAGFRAQLLDPTNGRSLLLNTHSAYSFRSTGGDRVLELTVLPRSEAPLSILSFQPGPSRSRSVTFDVVTSGEAELFLRVTSLGGRVIAETAPSSAAGATSVAWDGLDSSGRRVPRGTYHVTLIARNIDGETVRAVRTIALR